jgi:chromosome segregation ATPase
MAGEYYRCLASSFRRLFGITIFFGAQARTLCLRKCFMFKTVFAVMLLAASAGWGQTSAKDAGTTQALLTEVRELRRAIEGMTVASQRIQITLYALQMQDAAVARAEQAADADRNRCASIEVNRQHTAQAAQQLENASASVTPGVEQAANKDLKERLAEMKANLDMVNSDAEGCRAIEAEASNKLQTERSRLTELQDRIGRLDKALESLANPAK